MALNRKLRKTKYLVGVAPQSDIKRLYILRNAEPVHPGEFLGDEIDARGWSRWTLAYKVGLPIFQVEQIIGGQVPIGPREARAIGMALGTSTDLWVNLQAMWDGRVTP